MICDGHCFFFGFTIRRNCEELIFDSPVTVLQDALNKAGHYTISDSYGGMHLKARKQNRGWQPTIPSW